MEEIENLLKNNTTLKLMLINKDNNSYNKVGALEQIRLDTNNSQEFIYSNYHNILNIAKQ